jgi:hypothetical protein
VLRRRSAGACSQVPPKLVLSMWPMARVKQELAKYGLSTSGKKEVRHIERPLECKTPRMRAPPRHLCVRVDARPRARQPVAGAQ